MPPTRREIGAAKAGSSPGAGATTMLKELVVAFAPLASVTVAVIAKVPAVVGVPDTSPESRLSPTGKVLVAKVLSSKPPEADS